MNLRYVTEDIEIGGVTLRAGDLVRQALGSADRDPARFEDPDVFRIERPPARHLSFGLGPSLLPGCAARAAPGTDRGRDAGPAAARPAPGPRRRSSAGRPAGHHEPRAADAPPRVRSAAVRILEDLPRAIRELENVWIPLPDGERMAARVFLPVDAESRPGPRHHRVQPVSQARPDRGQQRAVPRLSRGSRLRGRPARDPGLGRVRRDPRRRVPAPRS